MGFTNYLKNISQPIDLLTRNDAVKHLEDRGDYDTKDVYKRQAQTLTFEEVTSWSFVYSDDGNYYQQSINGTTGYYNGLYVDAATGKLVPNGSTPNSAQFTTGAKISVPVSGKCTISVEAYQPQYALYTIGGTAADTTTAVSTYTLSLIHI